LVRHLRGFWDFGILGRFWEEKKKGERNRKETKNGGKKK
jgi:hypothetical protein